MEDNQRYILGLLHELIDIHQELGRGLVDAADDMASCTIIVPDIDDDIILPRDECVVFHHTCEFLCEIRVEYERLDGGDTIRGESELVRRR